MRPKAFGVADTAEAGDRLALELVERRRTSLGIHEVEWSVPGLDPAQRPGAAFGRGPDRRPFRRRDEIGSRQDDHGGPFE